MVTRWTGPPQAGHGCSRRVALVDGRMALVYRGGSSAEVPGRNRVRAGEHHRPRSFRRDRRVTARSTGALCPFGPCEGRAFPTRSCPVMRGARGRCDLHSRSPRRHPRPRPEPSRGSPTCSACTGPGRRRTRCAAAPSLRPRRRRAGQRVRMDPSAVCRRARRRRDLGSRHARHEGRRRDARGRPPSCGDREAPAGGRLDHVDHAGNTVLTDRNIQAIFGV